MKTISGIDPYSVRNAGIVITKRTEDICLYYKDGKCVCDYKMICPYLKGNGLCRALNGVIVDRFRSLGKD